MHYTNPCFSRFFLILIDSWFSKILPYCGKSRVKPLSIEDTNYSRSKSRFGETLIRLELDDLSANQLHSLSLQETRYYENSDEKSNDKYKESYHKPTNENFDPGFSRKHLRKIHLQT